jgi:hypothetical protein
MNFAFYMERITYLCKQALKHAKQKKYERACEDLYNVSLNKLAALKVLDELIAKMNQGNSPAGGDSGGPEQ